MDGYGSYPPQSGMHIQVSWHTLTVPVRRSQECGNAWRENFRRSR